MSDHLLAINHEQPSRLRAPGVDRVSEPEQIWPIGSLTCGFVS